MMQRYGLKKITLQDVNSNYDHIVSNTHFVTPEKIKNKYPDPLKDENIKVITEIQSNILVILGLTGIDFLAKLLKGSQGEELGLSEEDEYEVYCECDGFGYLTADELRQINDGWDWSHIRDSSAEGKQKAENLLKSKLIAIYNKT